MPQNKSESASGVLALVARVPLQVRYILVSLIMGGTWAFQHGPLWRRAVVMALLTLVGPPVLHWVRSRLIRGGERAHRPRASFIRFFGAKAILVSFAIAGTWLLQPVTPDAGLVVGLVLAATVATLGPILHPRMLIHPPRTTAQNALSNSAHGT
jgi:hypothetical protein